MQLGTLSAQVGMKLMQTIRSKPNNRPALELNIRGTRPCGQCEPMIACIGTQTSEDPLALESRTPGRHLSVQRAPHCLTSGVRAGTSLRMGARLGL